MNAMLPGQDPLQQHMRWAADQQKAFLDRRREQAGYEDRGRRRRAKDRVAPYAPPSPPPRVQPWQRPVGGPVPAPAGPDPAVTTRHHPVAALFTLVVMLGLSGVAVMVADVAVDGMPALVVAGGLGLVLTVVATRNAWRGR